MLVFPSLQFFWLVLCTFRLLHNVCGVSCGVCALRCGFEGAGAAEALSKAASTASGAGGGADVAPARQPITLIVLDSITGNVSLQYRYVARTHCPEIVRAEGFLCTRRCSFLRGEGVPLLLTSSLPCPQTYRRSCCGTLRMRGRGGRAGAVAAILEKSPACSAPQAAAWHTPKPCS